MGHDRPDPNSRSLLIVEPNPEVADRVGRTLRAVADFEVVAVQTLDAALSVMWSRSVDVVLLALTLPDSFGMGTVELILSAAPSVPVVVLATDEDDDAAEMALGLGAEDFVPKTADGPRIARALRKAIARRGHLVRNATLERVIGRGSTHDTLSGLPNRFLFTDRLRLALARNRQYNEPLGLLTLRVLALPWASEAGGHGAQDAVIAEAARRLRAKTRRSDTLARIDHAMFAVILERASSRTTLAQHLDDLVRTLEQPISWHGKHVSVRVQTGLAFCPDDASEGDALVKASLRDGYGSMTAEPGDGPVPGSLSEDSTSLFR